MSLETAENGEDVPPYIGGLGSNNYMHRENSNRTFYVIYGGIGGGGAAFGDSRFVSGNTMQNGGNGNKGNDGENYGDGGEGGHGGGGGGGVGGITIYSQNGSSAGYWYTRDGFTGGTGGVGGLGKEGCIFVYYRKPKEIDGGAIKAKDGKIRLDSTGRICVV